MATKITDRFIESLRTPATRLEIGDAFVPGMYLVVQPKSGIKSFAVRYRHAGRPVKYTLGRTPPLKLADARELARATLRAVAEGHDPAIERKQEKREAEEERRKAEAGIKDDPDLWENAFAEYLKRHVDPSLKANTAHELKQLFRREIPAEWHKRRLGEITRHDVRDLLDAVVDRGAASTANKVLRQLTTFFNFCVGRELIAVSPCTGVKKPTKESSRVRKLSDDEIRWLWPACDVIGWPFGPIVKLLILTGSRREEVRAMTERELDLDKRLWTIPGSRTKNGREHQVALTDSAVAILRATPRVKSPAGYVFTVTGKTPPSGFSRAKQNLDNQMLKYALEAARADDPAKAVVDDWVIHDLRRTMASGMARLGVAIPVIERCLNHVSGSFGGIVGVYQHHDFANEMRAAWDSWSRHVQALVTGRLSTDTNVR